MILCCNVLCYGNKYSSIVIRIFMMYIFMYIENNNISFYGGKEEKSVGVREKV